MTRRYLVLALITAMGCGVWLASTFAQRNAPFDIDQTRKELAILEGIFRTTIQYATGSDDRRTRVYRGMVAGRPLIQDSSISSFYLYGQGAVFMISNSRTPASSRLSQLVEIGRLMDQVEEKGSTTDRYLRSLERQIETSRRFGVLGWAEGFELDFVAPPLPPEPPVPPSPTAGMAPRPDDEQAVIYRQLADAAQLADRRGGKEVTGDELTEWIRTNRARLDEERGEAEETQSVKDEREQRIQDDLIEALARHGDSLSALGSDEYISLIFLPGSAGFDDVFSSGRGRAGALVTAVKMSQLAEYKRGNMSLEQLRSQLIQYEL